MTISPALSVCMIVRDEEVNLRRAIESVRDFASEVIVVDTGSRDRTVEIARSLGAKVSAHVWQEDFSLARNVAIEAASGDWILSLDADEWLDAKAVAALAVALERPCLAQLVRIDLVADDKGSEPFRQFSALRLFRRDARIRFGGRVHEGVAESLIAIGSTDWPESGVAILDDGYGIAAERQRKLARNLALLELARQDSPDDLFLAYKLAITLPSERIQQRDALLLSSIAKARLLSFDDLRGLPFMPAMLAAAVEVCVSQGRLCDAAEIASHLGPALGASSLFTAGRALARVGQVANAEALLNRFALAGPGHEHPAAQPDPEANLAEACAWLGWLSLQAGDLALATEWFQRGLATATSLQSISIDCQLIRVSLAADDLGDAAKRLERLYPRVAGSAEAYAELMLVSAELAMAATDVAGAVQLATAALNPGDDRAAALLAEIALRESSDDISRLNQLLTAVVGRRFDTLAQRVRLARRLGIAIGFDIPPAAKELAARGEGR